MDAEMINIPNYIKKITLCILKSMVENKANQSRFAKEPGPEV